MIAKRVSKGVPWRMTFSRFGRYWLPVLVWLGVLFLGSSDLMSAEQTSRFLGPFLRWLEPEITAEAIAQIHLLVRKGAHLMEYAVLAILLWRAIYRGTTLKMKMSILCASVWIAAALLAGADEFHQSFIASRTSSAGDVLIDTIGVTIGLALCLLINRKSARTFATVPESREDRQSEI